MTLAAVGVCCCYGWFCVVFGGDVPSVIEAELRGYFHTLIFGKHIG